MSELLPYEDELARKLQELPLPDMDMAWTDMEQRLDEDDDDGIIPFWLRGCALWGLLLILLFGLGLWFLHSKKSSVKDGHTQKTTGAIIKENEQNTNQHVNTNSTIKAGNNTILIKNKKDTIADKQPVTTDDRKLIDGGLPLQIKNNNNKKSTAYRNSRSKTSGGGMVNVDRQWKTRRNARKKRITIRGHIKINTTNVDSDSLATEDSPVRETQSSSIIKPEVANKIDPTQKIPSDPLHKKSADSTQKKNKPIQKPTDKQKKDSSKTKDITFSIGIAMNQQLPIDGQQWVSYNSAGRKGTLADYIPSVYVRMYKGKKWFIQGEFRYGAPQDTKDIVYQQKTDTAGNIVQFNYDTSVHLRKTYYHQLPITFNYFVTPNLSLGAGFIFNKFTSPVSEEVIDQHDNFSGKDSIIEGQVINPKKADSNFVSTYWQGALEVQYKWKKLSFGLRYVFGLEPYLKFTLSGGAEQQEKNQSFLLFVRYELWKSKKK